MMKRMQSSNVKRVALLLLCFLLLTTKIICAGEEEVTDEDRRIMSLAFIFREYFDEGEAPSASGVHWLLWNSGLLDDYYVADGPAVTIHGNDYISFDRLPLKELERITKSVFTTLPDFSIWTQDEDYYDKETGVITIPRIGIGGTAGLICSSKYVDGDTVNLLGAVRDGFYGEDESVSWKEINGVVFTNHEYNIPTVIRDPCVLCLKRENGQLKISSLTASSFFLTPIQDFDEEKHLYDIETEAMYDSCSFIVDEGCATNEADLEAQTSHYEHNDCNGIPDGEEFRMDLSPKEGYLLDAVALITEDGEQAIEGTDGKYSFIPEGTVTVKVTTSIDEEGPHAKELRVLRQIYNGAKAVQEIAG